MRWLWTLVVVMLVQVALPPSASARPSQQAESCIDGLVNQIAGSFGAGSGYNVMPFPGKKERWTWNEETGQWSKGVVQAAAVGMVVGSTTIWLYPRAFDMKYSSTEEYGGAYCTPEFLADLFPVLAHEILHFLCPGHPGPPRAA